MLLEKVREAIAAQLRIDVEKIRPESLLSNDLKADSLDLLELVLKLEKTYNVRFNNDEAKNIKTVQDIVDCLDRLGIKA